MIGYILTFIFGAFVGIIVTALVVSGKSEEEYLDGIRTGRELERNKARAKEELVYDEERRSDADA